MNLGSHEHLVHKRSYFLVISEICPLLSIFTISTFFHVTILFLSRLKTSLFLPTPRKKRDIFSKNVNQIVALNDKIPMASHCVGDKNII